MKLQNKLLAVLNDYYSLINERKFELENIVNDMEEVESLSIYQKLLDSRLEVDELIKAVEKYDFSRVNGEGTLDVIIDIDGNNKII